MRGTLYTLKLSELDAYNLELKKKEWKGCCKQEEMIDLLAVTSEGSKEISIQADLTNSSFLLQVFQMTVNCSKKNGAGEELGN